MSKTQIQKLSLKRKLKREKELEAVKEYVKENGSATPEDISDHINVTITRAGQLLSMLVKQGLFTKKRVAYTETVYTPKEEQDA